MSVVVVGLNHRSVRLEVLESMAIGTDALPKALHALHACDQLEEVVALSTCMRTELYVSTNRFHAAVGDLRAFLADWSGHPPEVFVGGCYEYFDAAAVRHLFRVASGLDSAVLGESEILRQVRDAWEVARTAGTVGGGLGAVFRRSVEAGKRVRSETAIGRGTTSLSHTAVVLAEERLASSGDGGGPAEPLRGRHALVLGAGEMGSATATLLRSRPGVAGVTVASRGFERARALADAIGATAVPWSAVAEALRGADAVFSATTATGQVLDVATVAGALARRDGRPLVVVDLALPRDVDPAVGALPGVALLDMHDLQARADAAMEGRRSEVPVAEAIVAEEVERWAGAAATREVAPLVAALHARAEAIRVAELGRLETRLAALEPAERRAVEALSKGIVAKLLHDPTVNLKAAAGDERGARLAAALAELWGLAFPGE